MVEFVDDPTALRQLYEESPPMSSEELPSTSLEEAHTRFIGEASLLVVATADAAGLTCSPRGGDPGSLALVHDDHTVWLPDIGGRIHQSVANLMVDPRIGLLFIAAARERTLRVEGTARVSADAAALRVFADQGHRARSVVVVDVHRVRLSGVGPMRRTGLIGHRELS